jgi:hypothetical protein
MNYQHYTGGSIFELLTKTIFAYNNINISLKTYEDFPSLQNEGIDAVVILPSTLKGKSIQVKMFKKTFEYGTFPWEVSRFLTQHQTHIHEPHNSDFHVIIDPVDYHQEHFLIKLLVFKTSIKIVDYYRQLWDEIVAKGNVPPMNRNLNEAELKFWIEEGQYEPSFKYLANKDIYQLKLQHTAYQRNVRCRWRTILTDKIEMQYLIPKKALQTVASIETLSIEEFATFQNNISTSGNQLYSYLSN